MNKSSPNRIQGYDLARALAIFGMVLVNFKIVMGASDNGPNWLIWMVGLFEGRAAATFVILAGVGLSLISRRVRLENDSQGIIRNRKTLLNRALFLFVVGLLYTPLWPADILHFYGIYIAIGAYLLTASDRKLWRWAISFSLIFVILFLTFNYEAGWNWITLEYADFWTFQGMIRHLFFNGFHPVFPWAAFLFVGMWLGRQDIHANPKLARKILVGGLAITALTELASGFAIRGFTSLETSIDAELLRFLFGTDPMPPMPQYMLSAGGTALVVIVLCVWLADRFSRAGWLKPLVSTGQLALTHYVAHIVLGMGILEMLGLLENQSLGFSVTSSILFCVAAVVFSYFWRKRFRRGPLEWVMRKVT